MIILVEEEMRRHVITSSREFLFVDFDIGPTHLVYHLFWLEAKGICLMMPIMDLN